MRCIESVAMQWLRSLGIDTPDVYPWRGADLPTSAIGPRFVVKPDMAAGGKGLQGLVRVEDSRDAACATAELMRIGEGSQREILIEEYIEGSELYVSISLDASSRAAVVRASSEGGVGFNARTAASLILRPEELLLEHVVTDLLSQACIFGGAAAYVRRALHVLWRAFVTSEATLIEINPFRWSGHRLVAVGIAVEFDDDATVASDGFRPMADSPTGRAAGTSRELRVLHANKAEPTRPSVKFVELDGDIALLVVGGGAGLYCLDRLAMLGLRPACYVDASPGAGDAKLAALVSAGLAIPAIRGALFGAVVTSLMDVRHLARALVTGVTEAKANGIPLPPLVARIAGPYEDEARSLVKAAAPEVAVLGREANLDEACDLLKRLVSGKGEVAGGM